MNANELKLVINEGYIRSEAFMLVAMKNGVFWDVMPCGFSKNRGFRGM
jgi:hypothetical protein